MLNDSDNKELVMKLEEWSKGYPISEQQKGLVVKMLLNKIEELEEKIEEVKSG